MTKSNSFICIFPLFPVFNPAYVPIFEQLTKEDSSLLYSILFENYAEVFNEIKDSCTITFFLDEKDKDLVPAEIKNKIPEILWINSVNANTELKNLNEKFFKKFHNNLIIFSHSIGVSSTDIKKIFSLLEIEDESVLLGRGNDERIALLGFNSYNEVLLENIVKDRNQYNAMLIKAGKEENFVHTLNNFMIIETKNDFVRLYNELSKKESLEYCNQNIHEKFTHLFIEYKGLLK